jgi:hypothetical protein
LLFSWSLDICTSKIFGTTMSQRFRHLFASSYGSTSLQWLIGCAFLDIGSIFSRLHSMVLIELCLWSHRFNSVYQCRFQDYNQ